MLDNCYVLAYLRVNKKEVHWQSEIKFQKIEALGFHQIRDYLNLIQNISQGVFERIGIEMTDVIDGCKQSKEWLHFRDKGPRESCLKEHWLYEPVNYQTPYASDQLRLWKRLKRKSESQEEGFRFSVSEFTERLLIEIITCCDLKNYFSTFCIIKS